MGENLALNVTDHGFRVAVWDRTEAKVARLIQRMDGRRNWIGTKTLEEFVQSLAKPQRVALELGRQRRKCTLGAPPLEPFQR